MRNTKKSLDIGISQSSGRNKIRSRDMSAETTKTCGNGKELAFGQDRSGIQAKSPWAHLNQSNPWGSVVENHARKQTFQGG